AHRRSARAGGCRHESDIRPSGAGDFGFRDRAAPRIRPAIRRLDDAPTRRGRFHRARARLSLPAGEGQFDRGRHVGDPAQHHRRAHPRAAAGTPGRQRDCLEGSRPMSDLLYSDTEEALRDSVRRLFADRCPAESVMRAYGPAPHDFSDVWHALAADLGMAGLLVPEQLGGAGAGAREAAVVMEEIGRAVAPVPFLSSAVLATIALLEAAGTEATETVKGLAAGSLTAALAVPLSTAPGDAVAGVSV